MRYYQILLRISKHCLKEIENTILKHWFQILVYSKRKCDLYKLSLVYVESSVFRAIAWLYMQLLHEKSEQNFHLSTKRFFFI